jgi:isochorismate pyruvate lyase
MNIEPSECRDLDEAHAEIDALDEALVTQLAKRIRYVERVAALKPSAGVSAEAPDRRREVMLRIDSAARDAGLPTDLAAALWSTMIDWAVGHEKQLMAAPGVVDAAPVSHQTSRGRAPR